MGSKATDPFGDIMQGVLSKQSMAEQKKASMASNRPPATPPRPAASAGANGVPGTPPVTAGLSQGLTRPSPARGTADSSPSSSAVSLAGLDDPFAGLGGFSKPPPMSASKPAAPAAARSPPARSPTPSHDRPVNLQQPAATSSGPATPSSPAVHAATFDLEHMLGSASTPKQQPAAKPAAAASPAAAAAVDHAADDPFAAFDTVEGAAAAVPATPPPTAPPVEEDHFGFPPSAPSSGSKPAVEAPAAAAVAATKRSHSGDTSQQQRNTSSSNSSTAAAGGPRPQPASTYVAQYEQQQQQQQQEQPPSRSSLSVDVPGSFSSLAAEQRFAGAERSGSMERGYGCYGSGSLDSYSGSEAAGGNGSARGWGGLLKNVTKTAASLGKKGLKAAQAGLAQLETALESMDRPAGSSSSRPYNGEGSNGGGQAYMPDDLPAERVLSIAIHISEMPSTRQEEALARLPRPVRQKVMALLREQAVIEGEEQMQGQGPGGSAFGPSSNGNSRPAAPEDAVIHTTEYSLNDADKQQPATPVGRPGRATPVQAAAAAGGQGKPSPAAAAAAPAPTAPAAAVSLQVEEEDLLGMSSPNPAATAAGPDRLASVADIDDFFSGGAAAPAAPGSSTSSRASQRPRSAHASVGSSGGSSMSRVLSGSDGQLADLLGGSGAAVSSSKATAPHKSNSMINLGGLEQLHLPVDVSQHGDLYDDGSAAAGGDEPELRRQLRAARAAEKHAKMKAALAEKQAKEAQEAQRRQQQQEHKQAHRDRIDVWKNRNKGNVRGLLGSLQTVLWEDSGWKPIGMGDLLEPVQVRKAWMKANLLVHPDKVRQRNGTDEQVAIADMIFDALKEAWELFRV